MNVLNALSLELEWKKAVIVVETKQTIADLSSYVFERLSTSYVQIDESTNAEELARRLSSINADAFYLHCESIHCHTTTRQVFVQFLHDLKPVSLTVYFVFSSSLSDKVLADPFWQSVITLAEEKYNFLLLRLEIPCYQNISNNLQELAHAVATYNNINSQSGYDLTYVYDIIQLFYDLHFSNSRDTIEKGRRKLHYRILQVSSNLIKSIGTYSVSLTEWLDKFVLPSSDVDARVRRASDECLPAAVNRSRPHYRVSTVLEVPFVINDPNNTFVGAHKEKLTGFVIEMMEHLAEKLNFNYTISLSPDGKYGNFDGENATGLMAELIHCRTDLVAATLIRSTNRQKYVSFTPPYYDTGITLFAAKPEPKTYSIWSFLDPFEMETWGVIVASWIAFSFFLIVVHRLSPFGLQSEDLSDGYPYTYKFYNSFWYILSTILQHSPEGMPFVSGRILFAGWFLFCLVIVSTYTANLAAFLTVQSFPLRIRNVDELAAQTEVIYGTVHDTYEYEFLKNSRISTFQDMYAFMSSSPNAMVNTSAEGIERVNNGSNYIFIWDESLLKYAAMQKPCTSQILGSMFGQIGYSLAMNHNMPYYEQFSFAILQLRDEGVIKALETKWLGSGSCGDGTSSSDSSNAESVSLQQMTGVFMVLATTLGLSVIIAFVRSRKEESNEKKPKPSTLMDTIEKRKQKLNGESNDGTTSEEDGTWV
ncbi:glutamate receptor 1-like [Corticium candelabrum]|uniref:glutamate receptor 1-like n=1 Tax=Corticium candelabrum TaxID=121492 RepID=UPI002E2613A7|nr:glutamate receptor 1-like [Corticium candelabrum]